MKTERYKGFTLIEIMIVAVVLALLAAIAIPSYREVVLKSRRSFAMEALEGFRLEQEKYRANCVVYANAIVNAGGTVCDSTVPTFQIEYATKFGANDGVSWGYTLSIIDPPAPDGVSYNLLAARFGDQLKDTKCGDFAVDQDGPIYEHPTNPATKYANALCWKR